MRNQLLAGGLLAAAALTPQAATAAATGDDTHCHAVYDDIVEPGFGTTPTRTTNFSPHPGTIRCSGPVLGHEVKGTGSIVNISHVGETAPADCVHGGDGFATFQISLPGSESKHVELYEAGDFTFGGLANGLVNGKFSMNHVEGTFSALPLTGDCLTTPITKARITVDMTVHR